MDKEGAKSVSPSSNATTVESKEGGEKCCLRGSEVQASIGNIKYWLGENNDELFGNMLLLREWM